ncbi:MAG TPA: chromate transporter, partial [Actinomycetota bacterium]|nr:chromate transporter [Actinomycetota bacterium]
QLRWGLYALAGGALAAVAGPFLVLGLLAAGLAEVAIRNPPEPLRHNGMAVLPGLVAAATAAGAGGLLSLVWVTFKVGALSYGGGFVIIPLMQHDVVSTYHWMSSSQFLGAVALGQVTPGPVVLTVSVIGYAAAGLAGAIVATLVGFSPSFGFVLLGARHFAALRRDRRVQAFLLGAGPAAIGAIAGSAIPLGLALGHLWQVGVLALAGMWLLAAHRNVVAALLGSGALGVLALLAGAPIGR